MISRADGVVEAEIDGERVLLAPSSLTYFGLNYVGARVWDLVGEAGKDRSELITELCSEFDIDLRTCELDVTDFLLAAEKAEVIRLP
jgi:hypothetical protein